MATEPLRSNDRILKKALELFSEKGYDATSVREICEAAGVTKPTLYYFYGSKEGVYRALVEGTLEEYRSTVRELVGTPGDVFERLRRVARAHFEYTRERPQLVRFLLALSHNPPSSAPLTDFHRYYEDVVRAVTALAEEGVARGELAPGPVAVRVLVFLGALSEALHGFLLAGHPDLTVDLADTLVDTILRGWTAPAPS
jgi:TetR/AcrR family transcriptional regulator